MKKSPINNIMMAAVLGGLGVSGYKYMKNNPCITKNMREMMKNA